MKIIAYVVLVALILGSYGAVWYFADSHGYQRRSMEDAATTAKAVKKARAAEQQKQEAVNVTVQHQADHLAAINRRLTHDIERLQQRARRRHLSNTQKADCQGTTGAQLSRQDAAFLTRFAAQCQRQQEAKQACYSYADIVGGKVKP